MKCPEIQEILDFIDGKMPISKVKKLKEHLETDCSKCGESYKSAAEIVQSMNANQIVDPPDYVFKKAISLFQRNDKRFLDWIIAKLDFDSWAIPALSGIRSEEKGPRQCSYITDSYKIVVLFQRHEKESSILTGQLLATQPSAATQGCLIQMSANNQVIESRFTDSSGEFAFSSVPDTNFDLLIHVEEPVRVFIPRANSK